MDTVVEHESEDRQEEMAFRIYMFCGANAKSHTMQRAYWAAHWFDIGRSQLAGRIFRLSAMFVVFVTCVLLFHQHQIQNMPLTRSVNL